jgi:hypothetical protein
MLLMMCRETPETCPATHKRQVINLWNCCILLVELFESYDDARTCERQTRFHICYQRYKSSAHPKTLPRAGLYKTKADVTGQDVSCRPWAANNPVTSLTSSNFQSALVSTHHLSLIQYFLSHCISKSLHSSSFSSFLVVSVRALV